MHNLSIPPNQKLFKVPLDPLQSQQAGLLRLHPLVHRLGLVPIHVRLAQHREADAVVDLAELLDLVVGARVLAVELVAGKAEHDELVRVLFCDLLVEGFEAGELRREAAFGSGVDDEDYFARVLREGVVCAFFYKGGKVELVRGLAELGAVGGGGGGL